MTDAANVIIEARGVEPAPRAVSDLAALRHAPQLS